MVDTATLSHLKLQARIRIRLDKRAEPDRSKSKHSTRVVNTALIYHRCGLR